MTLGLSRLAFLAVATFVVTVFACATSAQNVKINEAPLRDFAKDVQAKIDKKEIDVTKPFSVEMSAVIKDDGTLDKNASKFTSESGDPKMIEVAKQAVWAMGASGYFGYLQQMGISQATIDLGQTRDTASGNIHSTPGRLKALTVSSTVDIIKMAASQGTNITAEQKLILANTRASHDGGNVDITCTLPAADFQRMILGNAPAARGPSN